MKNFSLLLVLTFLVLTGTMSAQPTPSSAPPATAPDALPFEEAIPPTYDEAELVSLIQYPDEARQNNLEGRVVVSFILDENGKAFDVEAIESSNPLFDSAAVSAISRLRFTPAFHYGKPVRVRMTIPIGFHLSGD